MTTQTEAQRVKFATPDAGTTIEFLKAISLISARDTEWQSITTYHQRTLEKMQDGYDARITELEAANAELLTALVDVSYTLEKARIWGGMEWKYNPLHPVHYLPARDKARAAIKKHGGAA